MELDGSKLMVEFERERLMKDWIPRRLGGGEEEAASEALSINFLIGVGGKKESGQLRFGGRDRPFKKPIVLNDEIA